MVLVVRCGPESDRPPYSFTPTGLASSLALIVAELYLTIRFTFLISPGGLGWFSKLDLFGDSRVYRALSLLLLDVLTMTSAAKPTNLLVDFVPFAIGAVVVLCKSPPLRESTPANHAVASRVQLGVTKKGERGRPLAVAPLQRNPKVCAVPDPSSLDDIHPVH